MHLLTFFTVAYIIQCLSSSSSLSPTRKRAATICAPRFEACCAHLAFVSQSHALFRTPISGAGWWAGDCLGSHYKALRHCGLGSVTASTRIHLNAMPGRARVRGGSGEKPPQKDAILRHPVPLVGDTLGQFRPRRALLVIARSSVEMLPEKRTPRRNAIEGILA